MESTSAGHARVGTFLTLSEFALPALTQLSVTYPFAQISLPFSQTALQQPPAFWTLPVTLNRYQVQAAMYKIIPRHRHGMRLKH